MLTRAFGFPMFVRRSLAARGVAGRFSYINDMAEPGDHNMILQTDKQLVDGLFETLKNGQVKFKDRSQSKKYEAPGSVKIPGTVERFPEKKKDPKPLKKKPTPEKPKVIPNDKLINLSSTQSLVFATNEAFIRFLETKLPFEVRELVYLAIKNFKAQMVRKFLRPLHPVSITMKVALQEKIERIVQRKLGGTQVDWIASGVDLTGFPEGPTLEKMRSEIQEQELELKKKAALEDLKLHVDQLKDLQEDLTGLRVETPTLPKSFITDPFQSKLAQHFYQPKTEQPVTQWVYLYGLPYDFDADKLMQELRRVLWKDTELAEVEVFKYKDIMERPEMVAKELHMEDKAMEKRLEQLSKTVGVRKRKVTTATMELPACLAPSEKQKAAQQPANALSTKISMPGKASYDKSFLFVRMTDPQTKRRLLNDDMRLFGLSVNGWTIRFEDADEKITLLVKNGPVGLSAREFAAEVNAILATAGLEPVDIQECLQDKTMQFDESYLTFSTFEKSMAAVRVLRDASIRGRKLIVHHRIGGLCFIDGRYREVVKRATQIVNQELLRENRDRVFRFSDEDVGGWVPNQRFSPSLNSLIF